MCETWLQQSIPDSIMNENNFYTVYRRDRVVGMGGGAAFFIKKQSNYIFIRVSLPTKFDSIEEIVLDFF